MSILIILNPPLRKLDRLKLSDRRIRIAARALKLKGAEQKMLVD
jgi:hypothetical protein